MDGRVAERITARMVAAKTVGCAKQRTTMSKREKECVCCGCLLDEWKVKVKERRELRMPGSQVVVVVWLNDGEWSPNSLCGRGRAAIVGRE